MRAAPPLRHLCAWLLAVRAVSRVCGSAASPCRNVCERPRARRRPPPQSACTVCSALQRLPLAVWTTTNVRQASPRPPPALNSMTLASAGLLAGSHCSLLGLDIEAQVRVPCRGGSGGDGQGVWRGYTRTGDGVMVRLARRCWLRGSGGRLPARLPRSCGQRTQSAHALLPPSAHQLHSCLGRPLITCGSGCAYNMGRGSPLRSLRKPAQSVPCPYGGSTGSSCRPVTELSLPRGNGAYEARQQETARPRLGAIVRVADVASYNYRVKLHCPTKRMLAQSGCLLAREARQGRGGGKTC